jgi:diaminobutyrate-2-oxoglutarate transaminase
MSVLIKTEDDVRQSAAWESNARSYVNAFPIVFDKAHGAYLIDRQGRKYLDFLGGAGVLVLGHNHPAVITALSQQDESIISSLDLLTTAKLAFVERFRSILPGNLKQDGKIHFCGPTGSDAVEAALKLAALSTGRRGVIAFSGSYHGMTQGALAVSSSRRLRQVGLLSASQVAFCSFPYPLRFPAPFNTPEAASQFCLAQLTQMLEDDHSGVDIPGMILMEVVQGEGGTIPAPLSFIQGVASLCRKHGILLAVDEIQSGMGRTGRWFAFEHYGIEPDIVTVSKGIGGGLPLSMLVYHRRLDVWEPGSHIGTFRGQSLAMAAGGATIEAIQTGDLMGNAERMGGRLKSAIERLAADSPKIAEVRGLGLFIGVEMREHGGRPAGTEAADLRGLLLGEGVVAEVGGRQGSVLRLLPPLIIGEDEVSVFLAAFERSLARL